MNKPAGIILAGGQAKRMNGQDKGLVTCRGHTLVSLVIKRLEPQVSKIYISVNRSIDQYKSLGYEVVTDTRSGFQGPLSGISSALAAIQTDKNNDKTAIIVPCDVPLLPLDLVSRFLLTTKEADDSNKCRVAHDGEFLQSLFMLLPTSLNASIEAFIESGHRSARDWLHQIKPVIVDFSDTAPSFKNINTPKDLLWLEKYLS